MEEEKEEKDKPVVDRQGRPLAHGQSVAFPVVVSGNAGLSLGTVLGKPTNKRVTVLTYPKDGGKVGLKLGFLPAKLIVFEKYLPESE